MITLLVAGVGLDLAFVITFYVCYGLVIWWWITSGAMDEADDWAAIEDAVWRR